MLAGPIDKITDADLKALLIARTSESATLDFKRQLPSTANKDKVEFAKDVCAFANGSGGDLVYGVEEKEGVAASIVPITEEAFDAAKRRLGMVVDFHVILTRWGCG